MLERNDYPAGVTCWVEAVQPEPRAAIAFYGQLFGWEFQEVGSQEPYFAARLQGRPVAAVTSGTTAEWRTYVAVDNADDALGRVTQAGGEVIRLATDAAAGARVALVRDPAGAELGLWQGRELKGAQLVNEPNTWNWSDLNTRDVEGALRFYGAVFGWEAMRVDFGFGESYMWRAPGYSDFLESINPGVRERHREAGAPEGFTDAIGWLQRMSSESSAADAKAHWSVTFSVADTDAIAERTQQLGGSVLVPPFDVPYARMAVVMDPQGARFSISKYVPR